MRRYLGSFMTAYCAIVGLILAFGLSSAFLSIILLFPFEPASIFGWIMWAVGTFSGVYYVYSVRKQLYSWAKFSEEGIIVTTLLAPKTTILFKKCKSCGIGYYNHNAVGTSLGSRVCYIFFSYDPFEESYRTRMNMWKPTDTRIKIEFNKKTYNYLLSVLPDAYVRVLQRDYDKYVAKRR